MTEDVKMQMDCEFFRAHIDAYIDGELECEEREAMEEHARECAECAGMLENARRLAQTCASLEDKVNVPKAAEEAWFKAVRKEGNARRFRVLNITKRVGTVAAALVLLVVSVAGVSSLQQESSYSRNGYMTYEAGMGAYNDYAPMMEAASYDYDYTEAPKNTVMLESDGVGGDGEAVESGKTNSPIILRSATRKLKTEAFTADLSLIEEIIAANDAYFESKSISGDEENGNRSLYAEIRVPSDMLDAFLEAVDGVGISVEKYEYAEDVTASYTETEARLQVLRSQLEQLEEMNKEAQSVDDLISILERSSEVISEIEAYESQLRYWNSRESYSSVTLRLNEITKYDPEVKKTLGEKIKDTFENSVDWLKQVGESIVMFFVFLVPQLLVIVPVIVIIVVVIVIVKRKKHRK